ncbi:Ferredoxin [Polaromonas sp. OV174]|uniref:2Fe-2S iron-sulfur cluster-binding protein n=1 Tax=Polaromonas sp. OV174 TaxID=1855300 RepID=UPI0008EB7704|nr:2Fe-2S iron-sulfur cluster binding domain-containing protein [Polaromonas sp. OV174]SFC48689.1 Ferredoxin [Polaromonas sp. OV174]
MPPHDTLPSAPNQATNQIPTAAAADPVFTARIETTGQGFEAPAALSLLEAAEFSGLALPSSCRNGTCRSCICRLTQGRVIYHIAWPGLSLEEKQEGWILPCVAYPASDVVIALP